MIFFLIKIDQIDYTSNGDECTDKCRWDQNTNSSIKFMKCRSINNTVSPCTPFKSKIHNTFLEKYYFQCLILTFLKMLAILTMVKNVETNADSMENITTGVGQYLAAGKIAPQKVAYSQWAGAIFTLDQKF